MRSNTLVSCAVAAALAASASAAHATNIASYQANQSAGLNVNVFVAGSTAVDNTLASELNTPSLHICQAGTFSSFIDNGNVLDQNGNPIGGAIEYIYYCQADTASGVSTNMFIAVFKESTAGSIHGAQPLIQVAKGQQSGLTFLNPTGPDVQAGTCAGTSNTGCTASDFLQNVVPTGGVADVEANLLRTIPGGGSLSGADISSFLVGAPGLDIVWGVPVSKNLYYALQSAEGQTAKCPGGNLDSPTCAPSLSKEQVAALYSRDVTNWKSFGLNNPTGDNTVYICRRDVGSGTEASFEYYFLGARCSTSSQKMASQDGLTVIEQASTGNVLRCLRAFDQGDVNITPYNQDFNTTYAPFTPPGGLWAIGITSSELKPSQLATQSDTLRMIAVDGVLPTLENVVNGYDSFWGTDAWYKIKPGQTGAPTGGPLAVFNAIQAAIGHPTPTALADASYINVWGDGGDLAPASLFATSTTYSSYPVGNNVETTPVNLWTKASSGTVNNCDTPVLWKGAANLVSPAESTLLGSGPNVNLGP